MKEKCSQCGKYLFEETYRLVKGKDDEILSLCERCIVKEKVDGDMTVFDAIDMKLTHILGEKTNYKELGRLAFQYLDVFPPYTSLQRISEEMVIRGGVPGITSGAIFAHAIDYFPAYIARTLQSCGDF